MPSPQPLQLSFWTSRLVMKIYKDKEEKGTLELHILGLQCFDFILAACGSRNEWISNNLNHSLRS